MKLLAQYYMPDSWDVESEVLVFIKVIIPVVMYRR